MGSINRLIKLLETADTGTLLTGLTGDAALPRFFNVAPISQ